MIGGIEYKKVLEVTGKADYMGFVIVPPFLKQSMIEPVKHNNDLFQVKASELRYPTVSNVIVHEGNFTSVEVFVDGAFLLYESLIKLGIFSESDILTAAQHFILMDKIKNSGKQ